MHGIDVDDLLLGDGAAGELPDECGGGGADVVVMALQLLEDDGQPTHLHTPQSEGDMSQSPATLARRHGGTSSARSAQAIFCYAVCLTLMTACWDCTVVQRRCSS